jgi:transposase
MASRYEWNEKQWNRIADLLPGRKETVGRTAADNRLFVNSVWWVLRSGARGSDWPERYGKYKSVPKRFPRWAVSGVWDQVFRTLTQDVQNEYWMIDSTLVRAHQPAATGRKKGARIRLWGVPVEG